MEISSKKNMALKLELWLSAKQAAGGNVSIPSPLRPVIHSTSSHRRVSGFLAHDSVQKNRRKSFSRLTPPGDEDTVNKPSSASKMKCSPSRALPGDVMTSQSSPKTSQFTIFTEDIDDENCKENQPVKENIIRVNTSRGIAPLEKSKSVPFEQQFKGNSGGAKVQQSVSCRSASGPVDPVISQLSQFMMTSDNENVQMSEAIPKRIVACEVLDDSELIDHDDICNENDGHDQSKEKILEEDLQAMTFLNSILEQKINELEQTISKDRLEQNENGASRAKKHKAELKRLALDRASYEERAHQMIREVGEQMASLQGMAMGRIEVLENDLMTERHSSEALKQEIIALKFSLAAVKSEMKKARESRSRSRSNTETNFLSGNPVRESGSNSEADYFTDDTARASDDDDDDNDDVGGKKSSLNEAFGVGSQSSDSDWDTLPAHENIQKEG